MYGLYLSFLGLSFRGVSRALDPFVKRSHTAVWKWVQRYEPHELFDVKRIQAFLVDETYVKVRSFQTGFHKGRTSGRHPNVVRFGLFNAAIEYFHDTFVCRFWSIRNPPGEKDDFALGTMSTDLLHENSHGFGKIGGHVRAALPLIGRPPPKMPGIHDDIIPSLLRA